MKTSPEFTCFVIIFDLTIFMTQEDTLLLFDDKTSTLYFIKLLKIKKLESDAEKANKI